MTDRFGREIKYLRLSVTDRCNLRCRYCMPGEGAAPAGEALSYGAFLKIAALAADLGITRFKITGGEPLLRPGCGDFIRELKQLPGVEQVTLTTNGLLLAKQLDTLAEAGIDGINVSLDTLDPAQYRAITRSQRDVSEVMDAIAACAFRVPTKINAVALAETKDQILPLASLARTLPVDVRFIEAMPIGAGAELSGAPVPVLEILKEAWPDLAPTREIRGNGPARYFAADGFLGRIGLIEALGHRFCGQCNRLRLTASGMLLPCLYHTRGTDLGALLLCGVSDDDLREAIAQAILSKPAGHQFAPGVSIPGHKNMHQIGG